LARTMSCIQGKSWPSTSRYKNNKADKA
jgi:hypothetical protein